MATSNRTRTPLAPPLANDKEWRRTFNNWMQQANRGGLVATGDVTLTPNSTSTVVTDSRVGSQSYIGFMPQTSNAAVELNSIWVSSRGSGTFTITHDNKGTTDRTFTYCIMG